MAVGLLGGLAIWGFALQPTTQAEVLRFTMATEIGRGRGPDVAISPDGTKVVYRGTDGIQLYLRALDQLDAVPLRALAVEGTPFFSPDGESVGFARLVRVLDRVSVFGGASERLAELPHTVLGGTWGADDQIIAGTRDGLFRVPASGGEPEALTILDAERGETGHTWPSIIPDHQAVLFAIATAPWPDVLPTSQLAVLSLGTREVTHLELPGTAPRYVSTGHLVYVTDDGAVRSVPFDPNELTVTGSPVTLVEGVTVQPSGAANLDISDTGRLVYTTGLGDFGSMSLVWVDRDGRTTETLTDGRGDTVLRPRLSPDGTQVAFSLNDEVWIRDLERGSTTALTNDGKGNGFPAWSADGSFVTFMSSTASLRSDLYSRRADVSRPAEPLLEDRATALPGSWSPDGRTLVFHERGAATGYDLWTILTDADPAPLLVTESNEHSPRLSPNGQWLAYVSDQSGEYRVYVQQFPDGGAVMPVSDGPSGEPVWSRDGRELFYRTGNQLMSVAVEPDPPWTPGETTVLFDDPYVADILNLGWPNYDVSRDGQRFLMIRPEDSATKEVVVVTNWFEELTQRVPVD